MMDENLKVLSIVTFVGNWNSFLWPLIVLTSDAKQTLPIALAKFLSKVPYCFSFSFLTEALLKV